MQSGVGMNRRAQGLPITTIIIAILGLVVLVILFAITTGRLAIFGRATTECPGRCEGAWVTQAQKPAMENVPKCTEGIERELVGNYIDQGQGQAKVEDLRKCSRCCIALA